MCADYVRVRARADKPKKILSQVAYLIVTWLSDTRAKKRPLLWTSSSS